MSTVHRREALKILLDRLTEQISHPMAGTVGAMLARTVDSMGDSDVDTVCAIIHEASNALRSATGADLQSAARGANRERKDNLGSGVVT